MADEQNTNTPAQETTPTEPVKPDAPAQPTEAEKRTFDEDYVKELRGENAKWRNQVRDLESKMQALEAQQAKAKEAELAQQQRWQELAEQRAAELEKLNTQLKQQQIAMLRTNIGTEYGLPAALISRLAGETEDDIRADAEALKSALGVTNSPAETETPAPARSQTKTNVAPDGHPVGETDAQKRQRLRGVGYSSPLFSQVTITMPDDE